MVRRADPKPPDQVLSITAAKKKRKGVLSATSGRRNVSPPARKTSSTALP
jgi:hypothetical protein